MTGDGTDAVLLLLLLAALQLLSARARKSCSGAEATVSPATMATAFRPSCSMACLAASKAATLCVAGQQDSVLSCVAAQQDCRLARADSTAMNLSRVRVPHCGTIVALLTCQHAHSQSTVAQCSRVHPSKLALQK
jgi:hypothetical protein